MMLITMQLLSELGFLNTLSRKKQTGAVLLIKCSKFRTGKSTGKLNPIAGKRITLRVASGYLFFTWTVHMPFPLFWAPNPLIRLPTRHLHLSARFSLPNWFSSFPHWVSATIMNTRLQTGNLKSLLTCPSHWPAIYHPVLANPSPSLSTHPSLFSNSSLPPPSTPPPPS